METPRLKKKRFGLILVLISGFIYGLQPFLFSFCYERGATGPLMAAARSGILCLLLLPGALRRSSTGVLRRHWKGLLCMGLANAATAVLLYSSYTYISTGIATSLHFLYPGIVTLLCILFFRERPSAVKMVCVLMCLAGTFLILDPAGAKVNAAGVIMAVCSGLTWSLYIVWLDKFDMHEVGSNQLLFFVYLSAFAVTLLYYFLSAGKNPAAVTASGGWAWVLGSSAVVSVFGTLFFGIGVRYTDAETSAIASTLEPVVGVAAGIIFLREGFSLRTILGSLLIVGAVFLLSMQHGEED